MARSAEILIDQIKMDIFTGTLLPGDYLVEADLAKRFDVSRTPIREAIRSMVDCGLLETRSRKGAMVRLLTAKELLDLFEVAAELEAMACRLAASSMTENQGANIKVTLDNCFSAAQTKDIKQYSKANIDFHASIHVASGNHWLIGQLQQIQIHINAYRSIPYEIRGRLEKSSEEHREIFDAIMSEQSQLAGDLMRNHMMLQGKRLPSVMEFLERRSSINHGPL
ncbi:MAG: DNA-binding GntR family transcriptional regulator [Gammaproteobacteria bacterium]|jgi:DNA-binding GntR family transcriptional regulator